MGSTVSTLLSEKLWHSSNQLKLTHNAKVPFMEMPTRNSCVTARYVAALYNGCSAPLNG
jgi:hypothetical protein